MALFPYPCRKSSWCIIFAGSDLLLILPVLVGGSGHCKDSLWFLKGICSTTWPLLWPFHTNSLNSPSDEENFPYLRKGLDSIYKSLSTETFSSWTKSLQYTRAIQHNIKQEYLSNSSFAGTRKQFLQGKRPQKAFGKGSKGSLWRGTSGLLLLPSLLSNAMSAIPNTKPVQGLWTGFVILGIFEVFEILGISLEEKVSGFG